MITKLALAIFIMVCLAPTLSAQVPVREEPRHKPVLQNKYLRLLDVWMPPGDTSLYHIHATPSLFLPLSNTIVGSQIMGKEWTQEKFIPGKAWFRSFLQDSLVHRIANLSTTPLHVTDIEILSSYHNNTSEIKPLPLPLLFVNENSFAYQLKRTEFNKEIISGCGPIIAQLVTGDSVTFIDILENESKEIKTGKYLYIPPGSTFYFIAGKAKDINLVLFEIK
jgi:hypothetical protein